MIIELLNPILESGKKRKERRCVKVQYRYKHETRAVQQKMKLKTFNNEKLEFTDKMKPSLKKEYENPMFNNVKYWCPFTLRIDSYLGCEHDCRYCFARATYGRAKIWRPIKPANLNNIVKIFDKAFSKKTYDSGLLYLVKNRYPAKVGVMTDPFQPIENNLRITEGILKLALKYEYPLFIITKGIPNERHIELMKRNPELFIIDQSIITLDENLKRKLEENTPSIKDRIEIGNKLHNIGVSVKVNAKPTIPDISANLEFIDKLTDLHPTDHVAFEYLYLTPITFKIMKEAGFDYYDKMEVMGDDESTSDFCYFDDKIKENFLLEARKLLHKKGLKIGICDISFSHLSDCEVCCGVTDEERFDKLKGSSNFQFAIKLAKNNNGNVSLEDFKNSVKIWKENKKEFLKFFAEGGFKADFNTFDTTKKSYNIDFNKTIYENNINTKKQTPIKSLVEKSHHIEPNPEKEVS